MVSRYRRVERHEAARALPALVLVLAACARGPARRRRPAVRRALPRDAGLPRRPGGRGCTAVDRPARLRRHQGRRPEEAHRLAARAPTRGDRHRGPGGALGRRSRTSGATAGASAASSCRRRRRGWRSRSTRRPGARQNLLHIHISCVAAGGARGAGRRRDRAGLGAEPFLTLGRPRLQRPQGRAALEPSPFLLLRDLPGAAEDMARPVARGDRQRRRRLLPRHRLDRARGGRRDRGAARRDLRAGGRLRPRANWTAARNCGMNGCDSSLGKRSDHGRHSLPTRPDRSPVAGRGHDALGEAHRPRRARHRRRWRVCAKIKVPVWPSPVAISLGTFAVLTIGAAYGPRLGLATMLGWLLLGARRLRRLPELLGGRHRPRLHAGRDRRLSRRLPAGDGCPRLRRAPRLGPQRPGHGRRRCSSATR